MQLNQESCQTNKFNDDITSQCTNHNNDIESLYKDDIVDVIDIFDPQRSETPLIQAIDNQGLPILYYYEVDPDLLQKNENGMIPIFVEGQQKKEMFVHEGKIFIIDPKKPQNHQIDHKSEDIVPYYKHQEPTHREDKPSFQWGDIGGDRQLDMILNALNNKDQNKRMEAEYQLSKILKDYESMRNGIFKPDDGTSISHFPQQITDLKQNISLFGKDILDFDTPHSKSFIQAIQDNSLFIIAFLLVLIVLGLIKNNQNQQKVQELTQQIEEQKESTYNSQTSERSDGDIDNKSHLDKIDKKFMPHYSPPMKRSSTMRSGGIDFDCVERLQSQRPIIHAKNRSNVFSYNESPMDIHFNSNSSRSPDTPPVTEQTTEQKQSELVMNLHESLSPEPRFEPKKYDSASDSLSARTNLLQKHRRDRFLSQNNENLHPLQNVKKSNFAWKSSKENVPSNEMNTVQITDDSCQQQKEIDLEQESNLEDRRHPFFKTQESIIEEDQAIDTSAMQIVKQQSVQQNRQFGMRLAFQNPPQTKQDMSATKIVNDIISLPSNYKTQVTAQEFDNQHIEVNIKKVIPKQIVAHNYLALKDKENSDDQYKTPRGDHHESDNQSCQPFPVPVKQLQLTDSKTQENEDKREPVISVQGATSSEQTSSKVSSSSSDSSSSEETESEVTESSVQQTEQTSQLNSRELLLSSQIASSKFNLTTPRRNLEGEEDDVSVPVIDEQINPIHATQRQLSEISDESPLQNILDTGRFKKKFKQQEKIGEGGFGQVFKAIYNVDQREYAIKVVRLHIQKSKKIDPMVEIYQHRVYRELQAASRITSENIVRYFNSWFEELDEDEKIKEFNYKNEYKKLLKKKRKNVYNSKLQKSNKNNSLRKSLRKLSFGKREKKDIIKATKSLYAKENQITIQEESENDESDGAQNYNRSVMEEKKMDFTQNCKQSNHTLSSSGDQALEVNQSGKRSRSHQRGRNGSFDHEKTKRSVSANLKRVSDDSENQTSSEDEDQDSISEFSKGSSEFSMMTINSYLEKGQDFQSVNMYIQMEYCSGQSLENFLNKRNSSAKTEIKREDNLQIFTQVMHGMQDIHDNNVLHRDLKPENIFIDVVQNDKVIAKIGDFGLARMLTSGRMDSSDIQSMSTADPPSSGDKSPDAKNKLHTGRSKFSSVAGTEVYMAPEIKHHFRQGTRPMKYKDVEINKRQDIFQLGLILYEICSKIKSFHQKVKLFKQLRDEKTLDKGCCPLMRDHVEYDLIVRMTSEKPEDRPSAKEILNEWIPKWKSQLETSEEEK